MTGPGFLELSAEPRSRFGSVLQRLGQPDEAGLPQVSGDPAVDTWRRVRGAYLLAANEFAGAAGGTALQVQVSFDDEPIAIDAGLASRLFDVYAGVGWSGVTEVGAAIRARLSARTRDLSGGTVIDPWWAAWDFYDRTRKALAIVVGACLVDLESRVAERITTNLGEVLTRIRDLRDRLGLVVEEIEVPAPRDDALLAPPPFRLHTASNTELEATCHAALMELVAQRDRVEALATALAGARDDHRRARGADIMNRSYWSRLPVRESARTKAAAAKVAEAELLLVAAEELLRAVQRQVAANEPALLLLFAVARKRWTPARMSQILGQVLDEVETTTRRSLPPPAPRWITTLTEVGPGTEPIPPDRVFNRRVPAEGLERFVVRHAVAGLQDDPGLASLAVEPVWADLLDRSVPRGSFRYAVGIWYQVELGDHVMEREAAQRSRARWLTNLRTLAALVSLALVWLPPVGAAVRGVAIAVDLALAAESLYGVASSYSAAEAATGLAGAEHGADLMALTTAARYCGYRRDLLATLPLQLMLEVAAVPLGAASRDLHRLLVLRGWYSDLQTIAAWNPDGR